MAKKPLSKQTAYERDKADFEEWEKMTTQEICDIFLDLIFSERKELDPSQYKIIITEPLRIAFLKCSNLAIAPLDFRVFGMDTIIDVSMRYGYKIVDKNSKETQVR